MLLVPIIFLGFWGMASSGDAADEANPLTGTKRGMSSIMIGVFLVALACMVLATQSAFVAYLGVAVAKQWPEPKLSGIPFNDRMQLCCSPTEISLYSLNVALAIVWITTLAAYTYVWCDLTGSDGCCVDWVCILVGLIFWMVPGMHVMVSAYMTIKFMQFGWPLSSARASYVPISGSIVTGVPDVASGMPVDDTLALVIEE